MSLIIVFLFAGFFVLRLGSLAISIRNEKRIRAAGGREFGARNTLALALLHFAFYFASLTEAIVKKTTWGTTNLIGAIVLGLSLVALAWVIRQLSPIWTVKLLIAPDHQLNTSAIFRSIRHPNYFLNIIPELIGVTLLMNSWIVAAVLGPVYLCSLIVRIVQEERVMREEFPDYRN